MEKLPSSPHRTNHQAILQDLQHLQAIFNEPSPTPYQTIPSRSSEMQSKLNCKHYAWKDKCNCNRQRTIIAETMQYQGTTHHSPGAPSARPSTPPSYSSRPSTPSSYSSGPSPAPNYSPGSSRNSECSNCKHLRGKISVLKATMDMHMHPEQHTVNSAALLHEVLNEMEKLDLE
ncbi:hypothetical protein Tco_0701425 [Tanacetum coccineum]